MASFHFPPVLRITAVSLALSIAVLLTLRVWQVNTLPYSLRFLIDTAKPQTIGLDCLLGFVLLIVAKVTVIMQCRLFSKAAVSSRQDTTLGIEGPWLRANINSLNNDMEQGFLFFVNLLVACSFEEFNAERAVVLTALFLLGRVLYWGGYIMNAYVHYLCRLPGVTLTAVPTLSLVIFNLKHIF